MTRSASDLIETYLKDLRGELESAGAVQTDDLIAEVRSLLIDAAGGDPTRADGEIARFGEPAALAQGILEERGLDLSKGMSSGVWWRLGVAAPIDIAIGLALPLAAALPIYLSARFGQPRAASIGIAIAAGLGVLAWPFYIWRPWRRGGRALSPGMTLTGLAVVRAPGSWRLARTGELASMGLAPRRRMGLALVITLIAALLLAGGSAVGLDFSGAWLASAAISAGLSAAPIGGTPLEAQFQSVADQVYGGLGNAKEMGGPAAAMQYVAIEAGPALTPLRERIVDRKIGAVLAGTPIQVSPGVWTVEVEEYREDGSNLEPVGSSTFSFGRRQWLLEKGVGSDWVIVRIVVGSSSTKG